MTRRHGSATRVSVSFPPVKPVRKSGSNVTITLIVNLLFAVFATGCQTITDRQNVRPLVMRDVPAQRLAYRLEADVNAPTDPSADNDKRESIQADFNNRRPDDALVRTVLSPDKQRALALYGTENEPTSAFQIDLYSADGKFLKNLTPPDLSCVFPETVTWSPDGNLITFIAHKAVKPSPTPTPPIDEVIPPEAIPSPSVAPVFPAVPLFNTEQIYICNRDGYDMRPLTSREGLIYFYFEWAPDAHAVAALACREAEWVAREREFKLPAGRPRLINLDGSERLLDDDLTEALPVWSTDASKVATAFDSDVAIYDAATNKPTQARIRLRDQLIKASQVFDEKSSAGRKKNEGQHNAASSTASLPASFNPIVRLEWPSPDKLYIQTAYVRIMPNEPINTFQRWHLLSLSAQAAVLK
jgi:hypothetical protein